MVDSADGVASAVGDLGLADPGGGEACDSVVRIPDPSRVHLIALL